MATVARICRYPVKGLSAEDLPGVRLRAGEGVPLDRAFALARAAAPFDPARPSWLPKRHFLMLMRARAWRRCGSPTTMPPGA
jgi:hypothetical protein